MAILTIHLDDPPHVLKAAIAYLAVLTKPDKAFFRAIEALVTPHDAGANAPAAAYESLTASAPRWADSTRSNYTQANTASAYGSLAASTSVAWADPSIDKDGLPWDERIHGGGRTKNVDGTWRQRRNLPEGVREAVEAELRKGPVVVPPPPVEVDVVATEVVVVVPPPPADVHHVTHDMAGLGLPPHTAVVEVDAADAADVVVVVPPVEPDAMTVHKAMPLIGSALSRGDITQLDLAQASQALGHPNLPALTKDAPHLLGELLGRLGINV